MSRCLTILLALSAVLAGCLNREEKMHADVIYTGGDIWTGEPNAPRARAVAVAQGRILMVGTSEQALEFRAPKTRVVDLHGRFMMPGFVDSHTHFLEAGESLLTVPVRGVRDEAELARVVGERVRRSSKGAWITGRGWDHESWPSAQLPTRRLIDKVTPDNPVLIKRLDGHMALANSMALKLAGITASTADPAGGQILRDASGEATGILRDEAIELVNRVIPEPSAADKLKALEAAFAEARRLGVTTAVAIGEWQDVGLFKNAAGQGKATARIHAVITLPLQERAMADLHDVVEDDFLHWRAVKGYMDGSLGAGTAWLFEPYNDQPGSVGLPAAMWFPEGNMKRMIKEADATGLQVMVHAIGDRANVELLKIYEEVAAENGARDRRFRVEHAQHLTNQAINDFARLGVIASMQPAHLIDDGCWAEKRLGPARLKGSYALRSLIDKGVLVAFGTDWPVASLNPLLGVYAAVTRRTADGKNPDGWIPEQKISVEEALTCYTRNSAQAIFAENRVGTLKPGKLADMVILSASPFKVDPEAIKDISALETIVAGKTVYTRGESKLP